MSAQLDVNIDGARCVIRKLCFDANGDYTGNHIEVYPTKIIYFKLFESNQQPDNSTLEMYWTGQPLIPLAHFNQFAIPQETHVLNGSDRVLDIIQDVINHAYYQ